MLTDDLREICEKQGWNVGREDDEYITLSQHSPAGEDFSFSVKENDFVSEVQQYADDFDENEHSFLFIMAREGTYRS